MAASISGQSKFFDHKGNWESALNNRIANLSPSCVPQYNVQRFPSTCGTSHISIQEFGCCFTYVWGAGEEERRKKGSGLLCQHLEVKMRFKILECTTCYSPPHDLKGQAAAWAGLHTWTYYLHNLPSKKTEPLSLKRMALWVHSNQGPPSQKHKNSRWGCKLHWRFTRIFSQNYIYEQIKIRLESGSAC